MKKVTAFFGVVVVLFTGFLSAETELLDRVVAIVNDDVITLSEVENRYQFVLSQLEANEIRDIPSKDVIVDQILEQLVVESIQLQEAAYRGYIVSDEELTASIRTLAEQNGIDLDTFREMLERDGIAYTQFREDLHRQRLIQKVQSAVVNRRIYITEQDVKNFRNSPFFDILATDQYRIGHILVTSDNEDDPSGEEANSMAVSIIRQLRDGADFATMAVNHSAASTALEGGDLGWRQPQDIPTLFADVVIGLSIGDIADPIRNDRGIHIIKLLDKRGASGAQGEQTLVRHILIRPNAIKTDLQAKREVENLRQRIIDGEDFGEVAQEHSEDPGSARTGGELDWTDGEGLDPQFLQEMQATEIGELSAVFPSQFGWHVLEVIDRRTQDLSEERLNQLAIRALHTRQFEEAREDWLQEIRDEAFVKILHQPK